MLGEPLAEGEPVESRVRSIDAALGDDRGDYPKRCDATITKFYESVDDGDKKTAGLRELLEVEAHCNERCSAESFLKRIEQFDDAASAARIRPEGGALDKGPPRLTGKPFVAGDFKEIVPGTVQLQGMTGTGAGKTALLYRDTVGILHVCEVEPDGEKPVVCSPTSVPVGAQTARLVEGKAQPTIWGVVSIGATPAESKYGVFDARKGEQTEDDPGSVTSASDRPRLPAPSATWVEADLDGAHVALSRTKNGLLKLERAGAPPRIVLEDADHGGPSTGGPIPFIGKKAAVVLFNAKQGIAALVVKSDGTVEPIR